MYVNAHYRVSLYKAPLHTSVSFHVEETFAAAVVGGNLISEAVIHAPADGNMCHFGYLGTSRKLQISPYYSYVKVY